MPSKPLPKLNVHLGNSGYLRLAGETARVARLFPEENFVGIDIRSAMRRKPSNWVQKKADFKEGLLQLENESADSISSRMALGQKMVEKRKKYVAEVLSVAYDKLKKGGKLELVVGDDSVEGLTNLLEQGEKFRKEKISVDPLTMQERRRSFWTKMFPGRLYKVRAIK